VTVNYDNKGSIINAKFNSGNNVLFNIKQQWKFLILKTTLYVYLLPS
jgi:hypothetical protein